MISKLAIATFITWQLIFNFDVEDKAIPYIIEDCVLDKFTDVMKKDPRYVDNDRLYFLMTSDCTDYYLILAVNDDNNGIKKRLITTSHRFIEIGGKKIPLVFDYDLAFGAKENITSAGYDITLIHVEGYQVKFNRLRHCTVSSAEYTK